MTTSLFRALVLCLVVLPNNPRGHGVAAGEQPTNIVIVVADDLGYGDLSCFGQSQFATPELDRLAAEGARLTDFYSGATVCRPSRLALWTGQHTGHTAISANEAYTFQPEDVLFPELLNASGYSVGGIGKWAMGRPETSGRPTLNGFDFWMGFLDQGAAHNYYPEVLYRNGEPVRLEGNVLSTAEGSRGRVAQKREVYAHDVMTDALFDYLDSLGSEPFLIHAHWTIPHANNEGGRVTGNGMEIPDYGAFADRDWPDTEKGFAAMLARLDRDIGRLRDTLLRRGLAENTLLLFTSDNGPHSEGGHTHEFFDSNGPLRGFKRDLYEGGIRVPTIAWWPGIIESGSVIDEPYAFWDIFPTACELAGVDVPAGLDGRSMVSAFRGERNKEERPLYWRYRGQEAVRLGSWKAIRPSEGAPWELYDLAADVGEVNDVAGTFPDRLRALQAHAAAAVRD